MHCGEICVETCIFFVQFPCFTNCTSWELTLLAFWSPFCPKISLQINFLQGLHCVLPVTCLHVLMPHVAHTWRRSRGPISRETLGLISSPERPVSRSCRRSGEEMYRPALDVPRVIDRMRERVYGFQSLLGIGPTRGNLLPLFQCTCSTDLKLLNRILANFLYIIYIMIYVMYFCSWDYLCCYLRPCQRLLPGQQPLPRRCRVIKTSCTSNWNIWSPGTCRLPLVVMWTPVAMQGDGISMNASEIFWWDNKLDNERQPFCLCIFPFQPQMALWSSVPRFCLSRSEQTERRSIEPGDGGGGRRPYSSRYRP